MVTLHICLDCAPDMAQAIKEHLCMVLEPYGDARCVFVNGIATREEQIHIPGWRESDQLRRLR